MSFFFLQTTVLSHTSHGVKKCIEIALRCVEADRVKRPTIAEIVDELNKVYTAESSPKDKVYIFRSVVGQDLHGMTKLNPLPCLSSN